MLLRDILNLSQNIYIKITQTQARHFCDILGPVSNCFLHFISRRLLQRKWHDLQQESSANWEILQGRNLYPLSFRPPPSSLWCIVTMQKFDSRNVTLRIQRERNERIRASPSTTENAALPYLLISKRLIDISLGYESQIATYIKVTACAPYWLDSCIGGIKMAVRGSIIANLQRRAVRFKIVRMVSRSTRYINNDACR